MPNFPTQILRNSIANFYADACSICDHVKWFAENTPATATPIERFVVRAPDPDRYAQLCDQLIIFYYGKDPHTIAPQSPQPKRLRRLTPTDFDPFLIATTKNGLDPFLDHVRDDYHSVHGIVYSHTLDFAETLNAEINLQDVYRQLGAPFHNTVNLPSSPENLLPRCFEISPEQINALHAKADEHKFLFDDDERKKWRFLLHREAAFDAQTTTSPKRLKNKPKCCGEPMESNGTKKKTQTRHFKCKHCGWTITQPF